MTRDERAEEARRIRAETANRKPRHRRRPDVPDKRELTRAVLMVVVGLTLDGGLAVAGVSPFAAIPMVFAVVVGIHFTLRSWVEAS